MKKVAGLIFLFVALAVSAQAQISVMPKFGLTFSSVSFSEDLEDAFDLVGIDNQSKFGILGGAALNVGLSDLFSIQPELLFIQKGTSYEELGIELDFTVNYL
ncbi:MAG: hypothetical protein OHK0053_23920 [Microscillaceae bacterium]